jgi:rhodanese-related sulfurtransferase
MAGRVLRIDADGARALIETGDAVVIDVREPGEIRASGRVPGAINIPLAAFLAKTDPASPSREAALRPERPVILYCASGKRSEFAGNKLLEFGYREVFNLGGLSDWKLAGLPVDDALISS